MSSLFIFVTISLSLVYICEADLISDVCSTTLNPTLCTQTLQAGVNGSVADLRGLGRIIIPKAIVGTQDVVAIAKSISGAEADTCVETSTNAVNYLNTCIGYLKKFDRASVRDLQTRASAASTSVGTCDDEFGSDEPATLKVASQKARDLISVLLAIASKL